MDRKTRVMNEVAGSKLGTENDLVPSDLLVPTESLKKTTIEAPRSWQFVDWGELWDYRELLFFLVWRDVKVRYKQTVLGALWAILQPVMTMIVFTIFFGRLGGLSQRVNGAYPVFVYAALLPWTFFAASVTHAGTSVVGSSNLISKVYFPRLLVPAAAIAGGVVDFAIAFFVMLALMAWYGVSPSWHMLTLPLFVVGTVGVAAGAGTFLAALTVAYRDFRYVVGFLLQLWMFASPVVYPLEIVPEGWRLPYALNPMVGMISGFRSASLGEPFALDVIVVSTAVGLVLLLAGVQYFLQVQRRFADII
jgi:homopolymeric O-antigen transport system permease protein